MKNNFGMRSRFNLEELAVHRDLQSRYQKMAYYREIPVRGGLKGKVVLLVKRIVRKCIKFIVEPLVAEQNEFNAATANSSAVLYQQGVIMQEALDYWEKEIAELKRNYDRMLSEQAAKISDQDRKLSEQEADFSRRLEGQKQYVDRLVNDIKNDVNRLSSSVDRLANDIDNTAMGFLRIVRSQSDAGVNALAASPTHDDSATSEEKADKLTDDIYDEIDYFKFESHFRGSRERIKEVQQIYLPYFSEKKSVVDIGCGRGEFLEVLQENNIPYIGVDLYKDYVDFCRMKNLRVVCGDAVAYVAALEDGSIDGLFAAQLVEHLPTNVVIKLCRLAYKKLAVGGCFIMETPNPLSLSIYRNAFYLDPSHNKPVHPKFLEYLLLEAGFKHVEILFTEQSRPENRFALLKGDHIENIAEFNAGMGELSGILFGSQDYAVIATK